MTSLDRALLERMSSNLDSYGFKVRYSRQSFERRQPFGRQSLHLAFVRHAADFDVVADVAVRFDQVENFVNQSREYLSDSEKRMTHTAGAELGNIRGHGQSRWTVSTVQNVNRVAGEIFSRFKEVGLPFLERLSDLETVASILSSDSDEAKLISPLPESRAITLSAIRAIL